MQSSRSFKRRVYYLIRAVWAEESVESKPLIVHVEKQAQYSVKHSCTIQLGRVCHSSSCWITSALLSLICLVRPRRDWGAVVGRHKVVWNTHHGGKYSHWNIFSAYKKLLIYIKTTCNISDLIFRLWVFSLTHFPLQMYLKCVAVWHGALFWCIYMLWVKKNKQNKSICKNK